MDWTKWIDALLLIPRGFAKLLWYFQAPGMLSILGWLSALILLGLYFRRERYRHVPYTVALGLALLGFWCGHLNSLSISGIRTDNTEKLEEARKAQEESTRKKVEERRSQGLLDDVQFAEDDKSDQVDREKEADAKKSIYELAAEEGKEEQVKEREAEIEESKSDEYETWAGGNAAGRKKAAKPGGAPEAGISAGVELDDGTGLQGADYRKGGKKKRAADRQEKTAVIQKAMKQEEHVGGRLMKGPDVRRAQRMDRINLFFSRNTLWLAMLLLLMDYLFRANKTFWTLWPLPVAGRLVDYFHPKRHAVLVETGSRAFMKGYMETAIRKGESFLYFGEEDLWREPALLRMRIPPLPEACVLLCAAFVWILQYVGVHIVGGYGTLMARKDIRTQDVSRRSIAVRFGDRVLGLLDRGVILMIPPVLRLARFLAKRSHHAILTLRLGWITAQARYPLRLAPVAFGLYAAHGLGTAFRRRRGKGGEAVAPGGAFLLGRAQPDRIGRPRWRDRGSRLGAVVRRGHGAYRRFCANHPRWQEWVDRQWGRCLRLEVILFREGLRFWVTRLPYDLNSKPADRLFPFEAVWFNRYCCCITGREAARAVMPDLLYFLKYRLVPRARAWQTVNIVWDLDLPLDRAVVDELAFRCTESNLRLLVVSRSGWARDMADLFDEKAEEQVDPDDRARIENMAAISARFAEQQGWAA